MMIQTNMFVYLCISTLICLIPFINAETSTPLHERAFVELKNAELCFLSLTKEGPTGCRTDNYEGIAGTLRYLNTTESIQNMIDNPPNYEYMIAVEGSVYNNNIWEKLETRSKFYRGGILLHTPGEESPIDGSSDSPKQPLGEFDIHQSSGYEWNSKGTNILNTFTLNPRAMVSGIEADQVRLRARWNEDRILHKKHPNERVRLSAYMFAGKEEENGYKRKDDEEKSTSISCLSYKTCAPVGGYSAWASFGNITETKSATLLGRNNINTNAGINTNSTTNTTSDLTSDDPVGKPFVVAAIGMDTTALFRRRATGSESTLSHVTVFLSAAEALSRAQNTTSLAKGIMFVGFDAEKWGRSGSRRFLKDIITTSDPTIGPFSCPDDKKTGFVENGTEGCLQPYRTSTVFRLLRTEQIDSVVELHQVALDYKLFGHIERDNPASKDLLSLAKAISKLTKENPQQSVFIPSNIHSNGNGNGNDNDNNYDNRDNRGNRDTNSINNLLNSSWNIVTEIHDADANTPGIPPSASQSFVEYDKTIPALVLSDHGGPYVNKYFDSVFDDTGYTSRDRGYNQLCAHTTHYSRLLYAKAAGMIPSADGDFTEEENNLLLSIKADCDVVADLMSCLSKNPGCDRLKPFIRSSYTEKTYLVASPHYYSSVYYPAPAENIGGISRIVRTWIGSAVRNATIKDRGLSDEDVIQIGRWGQYHDALDPAIEYLYNKNIFHVENGKDAKGMIWTESNWDQNIGMYLFKEEDPKIVLVTWVAGAAVLVVVFIATYLSSLWCKKNMKYI